MRMASKGDVVMTPFGKIVATELRGAVLPLESVSIVDHQHLLSNLALNQLQLMHLYPLLLHHCWPYLLT